MVWATVTEHLNELFPVSNRELNVEIFEGEAMAWLREVGRL
jgi:hypothetical protein